MQQLFDQWPTRIQHIQSVLLIAVVLLYKTLCFLSLFDHFSAKLFSLKRNYVIYCSFISHAFFSYCRLNEHSSKTITDVLNELLVHKLSLV